MHAFGLLTSAATIHCKRWKILISMTVDFSSSQSGNNVGKHFRNLQNKMLNTGISVDMTDITDEDVEVGIFKFFKSSFFLFFMGLSAKMERIIITSYEKYYK